MILETKCKACSVRFENTYKVIDRIGFAQDYGRNQLLTCPECGADEEYDVDEFYAIKNLKFYRLLLMISGGLAFVLLIICLLSLDYFYNLSYFTTVSMVIAPFTIMLVYLRFDTSVLADFNRLKLKGHRMGSKISSSSSKDRIASVENTKSASAALRKINRDNLPSNKKKA